MLATVEIDDSVRCKSPAGCECFFIRFGSRGIKVYMYVETRDRAYSNQVWLHSKGLAPRAYYKGEVLIRGYRGRDGDSTGYCYETELADVFDYNFHRSLMDHGDKTEESDEYIGRFNDGCEELSDDLCELGIHWVDDHEENVGFIDGRPVLIDTADRLRR